MISSIVQTPLSQIPVVGGDVLHALKASDPGFLSFGEAYFSSINFSSVKAWKRHLDMTMNLIVPHGEVRFVFIDDSFDKLTITVGLSNYLRITVPPGIWLGFQGLSSPSSLVLNVSDIIHDPTESERATLESFDFDWSLDL